MHLPGRERRPYIGVMSLPTAPTPPPDEPVRRFDDREVGLIIQRAGELQKTEVSRRDSGGMSLAELEQVAREAGLDPALVRRAALEIDAPPAPKSSLLAGAPTRLLYEVSFDGELSVDEYEPLVAEIRRSVGEPGMVGTLGRTLTWSAADTGFGRHRGRRRQLSITVTPRQGRTTLRIEESLSQLAGGVFGGMVGGFGGGASGMGFGLGMGVLHSAAAATGIVGGILLVSYAGARGLFSVLARRRKNQLEQLRDRLAEYIERALR